MKEENYEVVVFQGDPGTIDLTYEEIEAEWNKMLQTVPQIGKFRIIHQEKKRYTFEDYSSQIGNADAALGIWVHKGVINEKLFEAHPNLKYIATLGHGFEDFDVEMTRRRGVTITNTIYGDVTIAQYAMALLMNICHNVTVQSNYTKTGYWKEKETNPQASYNQLFVPQIELLWRKKPAAAKAPEKKQVSKPVVNRTVRVDIEKLDSLMNLVSELIIAKNSLVAASSNDHGNNTAFNEQIEYLENVTTNLHESVMKVRMVPIESVVVKFPRMIRDLSIFKNLLSLVPAPTVIQQIRFNEVHIQKGGQILRYFAARHHVPVQRTQPAPVLFRPGNHRRHGGIGGFRRHRRQRRHRQNRLPPSYRQHSPAPRPPLLPAFDSPAYRQSRFQNGDRLQPDRVRPSARHIGQWLLRSAIPVFPRGRHTAPAFFFDGFSVRYITADFKGYSILPHSLTRKNIERRCHRHSHISTERLKLPLQVCVHTNVNICMDADLKRQFEAFCADMGMTMTTAFNVFARKAVREYRIPFEISGDVPNAETVEENAGAV